MSEEVNKFIDKFGYDTRVTGMGSAEDAFDEYGALLNQYDLDQETLVSGSVVNLFYVFHSEDHDGSSMGGRVHYDIVLPSMKDLKGYVNFYAFDCQHPERSKA